VYEWIEMFKNGRTSMTDAELSGHPNTATTEQNEERARELILKTRRVTFDKIAKQLNISIGSAYSVEHDNLRFHKVCARWASKELTDEHKHMRLDICSHHLVRYLEEGDNFLQRIITGDETRVHHYQPETKRKIMQWKQPSSPAAKEFKTQPSASKLMFTIFWDSQRPILETYPERGATVISATYYDMLQRERPVVARQYPSPYCGPHVGNLQEIELGNHGTSSSQSRFGAI
jgi:hypothetical protein